MDDRIDHRATRLDRRLRIAVRLVLYPMALGLIVLAWQRYHGAPSRAERTASSPAVGWSGQTSQGHAIRAVTRKGRLLTFNTHVLERCSDGSTFTLHWFPGEHRFVQHGAALRGHQAGPARDESGRRLAFDGSVRAQIGNRPRGTIRMRTNLPRRHHTVRCHSGAVTFALRRMP